MYDELEDEGEEKKEGCVEYVVSGGGYQPSPKRETTKALPPGIYRIRQTMFGNYLEPHTFIKDDLIRLPDTKSEELVNEVERFWALKPVFDQYRYVHKRGILMHGPPGTGKTSTLAVITDSFVASGGVVIYLNTDPSTLAAMLQDVRQIEPERRIIVIVEDLENFAHDTTILSLLDGENSVGNIVFIGTTNYIERLPDRIKSRPSRFDKVVEIGPPSREARAIYLRSRSVPEEQIPAWLDVSQGFAFAHLKELVVAVLCFGNDLLIEAGRVRSMVPAVMLNTPDGELDVDEV